MNPNILKFAINLKLMSLTLSTNSKLKELRNVHNRTRSQTIRAVLNTIIRMPDATLEKMREVFPEIDAEMSAEEAMTLMVVSKVMKTGDVNAYNALLDSAYGKPTQVLNIKDESVSQIKMPQFLAVDVVEINENKDESN